MPLAIQLTIFCLNGDGGSLFFLKCGGHMKCEITGGNKYSKELEQGGLEIPARLTMSNTNKKMTDVMKKTEHTR